MPKIENLNEKQNYNERPARPPKLVRLRPFERKKHLPHICGLTLLALGIALGGFFPGYYYYKTKMDSNTVIVKGLSERDVKANLAIWELKYVVTGTDALRTQKEISHQTEVIKSFLKENGIKKDEITVGRLETNDLMANPYRSNSDNNDIRFILTQSVTVKSENVDLVAEVLNKSGDLVAKGIIFNSDYGSPVSYLFTKINEVKPQMLNEAIENAHQAALQFASVSKTKVGNIKNANQGVFSILPSEQTASATESQQINKKVRVVSTIEYWLK